MKKIALILLTTLALQETFSQLAATTNIIANTFLIETDTLTLTGFVIDYDNEEYLITARHGFKRNDKNNSTVPISLLYDSAYINLQGKLCSQQP